jgi:hypothetical protein
MTKTRLAMFKNHDHYFPKGYSRAPDVEFVPVPRADEAILFEDFFITGLRMPPHLVPLDILHKFQVQLYQLTPNDIVHISKFI